MSPLVDILKRVSDRVPVALRNSAGAHFLIRQEVGLQEEPVLPLDQQHPAGAVDDGDAVRSPNM